MTCPVALAWPLTASACDSAIFWMMADLFSPVPAALAPAFWTKKTSSVGSNLLYVQLTSQVRSFTGLKLRGFTYQTTASWNKGSVSVSAISDRVGSEPMMERKSLS